MSYYFTRLLKLIVVFSCLLFVLSGCISLLAGVPDDGSSASYVKTPLASNHLPTATSTPLSDHDLAAAIVKGMTLDQKLGQMVIVEFKGATLGTDLTQMIQTNQISGVLIENNNGNVQTHDQLVALNKAMQGQAHMPLFITTDYEGGPVNELRLITGERPSATSIGATGDPQQAYNAGYKAAQDLAALGLNVNFMPIVDVLTNPSNPGLQNRTFGSDPTLVTNMGRAYLKGLTDGGLVGCLKHFPGLGSANINPHISLPYMNRSLTTLKQVDLVPYSTLIGEGYIPMVMVTHILNSQLDPTLPASLSPNVVTKLLRNDLNFQGVIISDTLWMGGISNTYDLAQAAVLAVKAGTDLLLGPRTLAETQTMLYGLRKAVDQGEISVDQIATSVQRIIELKLRYKIITHAQALQLIGQAYNGNTCPCAITIVVARLSDMDSKIFNSPFLNQA